MPVTGTLPKVDARGLAWAAEMADGNRDIELVLFRNGNRLTLAPENDENQDNAILKVFTASRKHQHRTQTHFEIPVEWDSLFLTESAVEKFLFPYYEAQRLLPPHKLQQLKDLFYSNAEYIGIAHLPPSRPLLLRQDGSVFELPVDTGVDFPLRVDGA